MYTHLLLSMLFYYCRGWFICGGTLSQANQQEQQHMGYHYIILVFTVFYETISFGITPRIFGMPMPLWKPLTFAIAKCQSLLHNSWQPAPFLEWWKNYFDKFADVHSKVASNSASYFASFFSSWRVSLCWLVAPWEHVVTSWPARSREWQRHLAQPAMVR